ncbi:hypothetical protein HanRHA438_Chr11g0492121 [Helianthus annuus]|nr:hypothetical protein HanRHA438_Chr11g0492121 [Helianthus annuus]
MEVTGDKHLCSVAVNGDERRKNEVVRLLVAGLSNWYISGDNSRFRMYLDWLVCDKRRLACCVISGRKRSIKAGGFGFVSFGKVRKRKKRVACFLCRWRAS